MNQGVLTTRMIFRRGMTKTGSKPRWRTIVRRSRRSLITILIVKGALLRDESRGAHYKDDFPKRDDKNWLKTTMAHYSEEEPAITYKDLDREGGAPPR